MLIPMKNFHLHLVSDSTGETVSSVARAALAQFEKIEPIEHTWTLIRTARQMERVIEEIEADPGIVLHTIVDNKLRDMLRAACKKHKVPCIPVLKSVVNEFATYLRVPIVAAPGKQYELDDDYFARVEAINYSLAHDDGQATWNLEEADIVLVGPSRTSKSPTCMHLANRGFKAANVPYVKGVELPEELFKLERPLIVGLTIDLDRLIQIRESRLQSMKEQTRTDYVNSEEVESEIAASRKLFVKQRWPIIDVTNKSVEETAANILKHYKEKYGTSQPLG